MQDYKVLGEGATQTLVCGLSDYFVAVFGICHVSFRDVVVGRLPLAATRFCAPCAFSPFPSCLKPPLDSPCPYSLSRSLC